MENVKKTIYWSKPSLSQDEADLALEAIESTWVSGGDFVEMFEHQLSEILGVENVISVNNGTSALLIALVAADIRPGDAIIVPAYGFMAAANVALISNLKIIFADVYKDTWNINLNTVSKKDLNRARAVICIDTYGNPCDLIEINAFADRYGWKVIQDCAESLGSKVSNCYTGTQVDFGTYSFHATKLITTGEGGAFVTNDSEKAQLARLYRSHGMDRQIDYLHTLPGNNLRLSNILAAIGVAQLPKFHEFVESRKKIDVMYRKIIPQETNLKFQFLNNHDVVPWSFPVLLNRGKDFRDLLQEKLKKYGIETRTGFKSPRYLKYFGDGNEFETADYLSDNILSLPAYPGLTPDQIEFISSKFVKNFYHES